MLGVRGRERLSEPGSVQGLNTPATFTDPSTPGHSCIVTELLYEGPAQDGAHQAHLIPFDSLHLHIPGLSYS